MKLKFLLMDTLDERKSSTEIMSFIDLYLKEDQHPLFFGKIKQQRDAPRLTKKERRGKGRG